MTMETILGNVGLAILKALVTKGVGRVLEKDLFTDDGTDSDVFRGIMREAFVDAVKKVRKDLPDATQKKYETDEFRYYQKALLDELCKLDSVERKTFIEKDLYIAFKNELLNRQDGLAHVNMAMASECLGQLQVFNEKIENLGKEMADVKNGLTTMSDKLKKLTTESGMSAARIIEDTSEKLISLPELLSKRKAFIEKIKTSLEKSHAVFLYAGVKEGKTVVSLLLSKQMEGYKLQWLDFGYENVLNIENILRGYNHNEKLLIVLDSVKYNDERLYERLSETILKEINENWLFVITSYDKLSEQVYLDISQINEIQLPPLTLDEIKEMIPEHKHNLYATLIYALFNGQPLLTNMACSYLKVHNWVITSEKIEQLFSFPKGTPLESIVKKTFRRMMLDEESYHLMNRLLLFDKPFTITDCEDLAAITPLIINPGKKLESLCGTWIIKEEDKYRVSNLLRKSVYADLLPQERKDCYELLAKKIIHQEGGMTPLDASRVVWLFAEAKDDSLLTGFYISALQKLQEQNILDKDFAKIWRLMWIDVPLPTWMCDEHKLMIRSTQLQLLVMNHYADSEYILDDIEHLLPKISDRSEIKSVVVKFLISYYSLTGNSNKALDYQLESRKLIALTDFEEIDDEKVLILSLDHVSTKDQLIDWGNRYKLLGNPEVELLADGVLIAINRICNEAGNKQIEETLSILCQVASDNKMDLIASAACAKWIDVLHDSEKFEDADVVFKKYKHLTKTKFGSILINYSFGLCLIHQGDNNNGESFIELACHQSDLRLVSGVQMNAHCTLAQLKGNKGDYQGALNAILQISNHVDFLKCFSEYEHAFVYGTLGYAYWMTGDKINGVKNLLLVEKLLWDKHGEVDDDFKNLSIRFCITALYLNSTLEGNRTREDFVKADYGTFTKEFPWIKDEYNPLRNFTMMYPMYEMTERVLHDNEISIRMIEHMIAYQQRDAVEAGNLLCVMMLAYPICLETGRFDLLEYIVLKSLAGSMGIVDDSPVNYEDLVLINAITSLVMKRTCMIAEGQNFDEEWMCDFVKRAQNYLKDSQKTDYLIKQMLSENPNFKSFTDAQCRYTASAYRIEIMPVEECLITLYTLCNILLSTNKMPSAHRMVEHFAKSFALMCIKVNPTRFSSSLEEMNHLLEKINNRQGMDYVRGVLEGLHFKMKAEPIMSKELESFMDE